jgi:nucleotide-binding universal stress UspA family protein
MKTPLIQTILVPIDFSPLSIKAVAEARRVAEHFGAVIHLAHIAPQHYPAEFMGPVITSGKVVESFEEHQQKSLSEQLEEVARQHDLSPSTRTHVCVAASVFHEICRLAQELAADMIVMPTHGRTGFQHVFLGSTAERVVQHAPCPVLIVRPSPHPGKDGAGGKGEKDRQRRILVPVDFSPASLDSLRYAISIAADVGAQLFVLHAVNVHDEVGNEGLGVYRLADFRQTARRDAEREMEQFLKPVDFGGVPCELLICNGKPAPEICEAAERRAVDLIVTGTHGRTGFKHLVMGSVAEQVVRTAARSVLVVPSHPKVRVAGLKRLTAAGPAKGVMTPHRA